MWSKNFARYARNPIFCPHNLKHLPTPMNLLCLCARVHVCMCVCVCTTLCVDDVYLFVVNCVDCCVALVLVLSTLLVSHSIPQLCSSLFLTTPHLLYLQEQRQRATTFTKRLRKIFDNLEWMFLRGRVLKQVEQASREFPSPGSTGLYHQGKQGKKRTVTSEPKSAARSLID